MKIFHCDACGALVFFENVLCVQCRHVLGFLPDIMDLAALEPEADEQWRSLAADSRGQLYRRCANGRDHSICNWYIPGGAAESAETLCEACRLTAEIPDLAEPRHLSLWYKLEMAKRRLIYTLRQLRLPVQGVPGKSWPALRFRFLADATGSPPVLTGHDQGVITVNLVEADDVAREQRRAQFHEPQRTLVGHLRHESGHYYWSALIAGSAWQARFRELFGDETADYREALQKYYAQGADQDWAARCVSAYASAHPWEDWAESWAHLLQMIDALETAAGFGMSLRPRHPASQAMSADPQKALAGGRGFDSLLAHWFPLTYALNALNRGLGVPDAYPFVLSSRAVEKLRFIHQVITETPLEEPRLERGPEDKVGDLPRGLRVAPHGRISRGTG
jgi:hypothetical protein